MYMYNDSLPHSPCTPLTKYMYIYIGYLSVTLAHISVGLAVSGLYCSPESIVSIPEVANVP